jgi:hypothetical protein
MNKIEYIDTYLRSDLDLFLDYSVIQSLIYALSPQEACQFFDFSFKQNYRLRRCIIRKISNDISTRYLPDHKHFIDKLLNDSDEKGNTKKESCFSTLDFLFDCLPKSQQNQLLHIFLDSKSRHNRERGYKKLKRVWKDQYVERIQNLWLTYHDVQCLNLVIDYFPVGFLEKYHLELIQNADSYQLSRLYLRLSKVNAIAVETLRRVDPITYAYVLVKINKTISDKDAHDILMEKMEDERIGLLLWCFGQMKLWDIIVEYIDGHRIRKSHMRMTLQE